MQLIMGLAEPPPSASSWTGHLWTQCVIGGLYHLRPKTSIARVWLIVISIQYNYCETYNLFVLWCVKEENQGEANTKKVENKMKLKYIGPSFGVDSLTNGKEYVCLGVENGLLRIIDDSGEDYLYSVIPGPLWDASIRGEWILIEDSPDGTLAKVINAVKIYITEGNKN